MASVIGISKQIHLTYVFSSTDVLIVRRLSFRAYYSVKCSLLEDRIVKSTISSIASSNFNQLKPICGQGECET